MSLIDRVAVGMGIPIWGFPWVWYGMGMGTVMDPHGLLGILWGFLKGYYIKR